MISERPAEAPIGQSGGRPSSPEPVQLGVRADEVRLGLDQQSGPPGLRLAYYQAGNLARRHDPGLAGHYRALVVERRHIHISLTVRSPANRPAAARALWPKVWPRRLRTPIDRSRYSQWLPNETLAKYPSVANIVPHQHFSERTTGFEPTTLTLAR